MMVERAHFEPTPEQLIDPTVLRSKSRMLYLIVQAIHLSCLYLLSDYTSPLLLGASGLLSLAVYSWVLLIEIRCSKLLVSPFIVYLCAGVLVLGLAPLWAAAVLAHGLTAFLRHGPANVSDYLLNGHMILLLGDWWLVAGYAATPSGADKANIVRSRGTFITRVAIGMLIAGWLFDLAPIQEGMLQLGNLYKTLGRFSGPAGLLLLLYTRASSTGVVRFRLGLAIIFCTAIELSLAMRSIMKQDAVQVALPFLIYLLSRLRSADGKGSVRLSWTVALQAVGILLAIAIVLFPISQMRRADSEWAAGDRLSTPDPQQYIGQVLRGAVPGTSDFARVHEFPHLGFWSFLKRQAYLIGAGWTYSCVRENGTLEGELIVDGLVSLVPRMFWPEKPTVSPGRKIAVLLGQSSTTESATAATDAGSMAGALYLNWGIPSLILGMFVNGIAMAVVWKQFRPYCLSNPFATIGAMILFVNAGRHFSSSADGNVAFYAYLCLLFLPATLATRRFFQRQSEVPDGTAVPT